MFLSINDVMNWLLPISLGLLLGYYIATRKKTDPDSIIIMNPEEFRNNMRKGQLFDIRKEEEFKKSKINGSRNFPKRSLLASLYKIRKDQAVFLYSDTDKGVVKKVANKLSKKGYNPIYILKGGFNEWPFSKK
ncbi:MAG: hypothetical protein B6I17_00270 [Tenericutes bacterium 4572_104]|nr:MAG: hypothetical protein B6I17_00270 [Tenericutes bacterium 4572_104]